jgi:hypothetical protein
MNCLLGSTTSRGRFSKALHTVHMTSSGIAAQILTFFEIGQSLVFVVL